MNEQLGWLYSESFMSEKDEADELELIDQLAAHLEHDHCMGAWRVWFGSEVRYLTMNDQWAPVS